MHDARYLQWLVLQDQRSKWRLFVMYMEVWLRAVSVPYCFAPAAAILLFVACYNSRPLVAWHDIHYEDLWCQRAECIAERRRRARGQNERDGAGQWPVVELRHCRYNTLPPLPERTEELWSIGGTRRDHHWQDHSRVRVCVCERASVTIASGEMRKGGKELGF